MDGLVLGYGLEFDHVGSQLLRDRRGRGQHPYLTARTSGKVAHVLLDAPRAVEDGSGVSSSVCPAVVGTTHSPCEPARAFPGVPPAGQAAC